MTGDLEGNMSNDTGLEAILDAEPAAPMAPMVPEERQQEPQQGDKQQGAEPPAATKQDAPEPGFVPRDALMDERRKRQELERRFQELEAKFQQPKQEQVQPDWFTDPQQAAEFMRYQIAEENFKTRVEVTELVLSEKYPDYTEKRDVFAEAARQDLQLARRLIEAPNPAKFAYDMGKKIALQRDIGDDPSAYQARLEAEFKKKYGIQDDPEGSATTQPIQQRQQAPVPRSLAKTTSAPARAPNGRFSGGPTPLEDIIG